MSLVDVYRAALIRCAELAGADTSSGVPTWPPVEVWAVQQVEQLRADYDEAHTTSDAQAEIARLKDVISACIPWLASHGRGAAQEALADACESIGINPLAWSAHPEVLLRRRRDLERRASQPQAGRASSPDSAAGGGLV